ncbi:uncharacterized protein LOC133784430 [Humulus lupulus]|uniref:uncharacterized protein LOC133784430 n=1 Tax=Humulus lupulus TaxID=3486 RepID=UPI002B401FF5|nr:uncharacterized protein LOC133784430 [Humulus lupulus]
MASKLSIIFKVSIGLPMFLKILLGSVKYVEPGFMIDILMETNIMGEQYNLYISDEDIVHFGLMEEISAFCISFYISIIYSELCDRYISHFFGFIEPSWSLRIGTNMDNRAEIILERINNTVMGQTWLMPYHLLRHWMLVIIDPDDDTCYHLDPLKKSPPNDLKNLMNSVSSHIKQKTGRNEKKYKWKIVNFPRQTSSVECGFYIIRMMKDYCLNETLMR